MANLFIFDSPFENSSPDGGNFALETGDSLRVHRVGSVMATGAGGDAVQINGGNVLVVVEGQVFGDDTAIREASGAAGGSRVVVASTGVVIARGGGAVELVGANSRLINEGLITGGEFGVGLGGVGLGVTNRGTILGGDVGLLTEDATGAVILNTGLIEGRQIGALFRGANAVVENSGRIVALDSGDEAAAVGFVGSGTFDLTNAGSITAAQATGIIAVAAGSGTGPFLLEGTISNTGTIQGATTAIDMTVGSAADVVVLDLFNDGVIRGDVRFGAGDDVYEGGSGRTVGTLLGGGGVDTFEGGAFQDRMDGGLGNDVLDGGGGNDVVAGGAGADALEGGAGFDRLDYTGSAAAVAIDLLTGIGRGGDAAGDRFDGFEAVLGSARSDRLLGDDLANLLVGGAGDDAMDGRGGNDRMRGGVGLDTLTGGLGSDVLEGGAGRDRFRYASTAESSGRTGSLDLILDFVRGQDRIDLATVDANAVLAGNQAFAFVTGPRFTAAGQVRSVLDGGTVLVLANTDANLNTVELAITLVGTQALARTDFLL